MPEQLTKHPEVTIYVLRSAGAKCGEGLVQEILTKCPAEFLQAPDRRNLRLRPRGRIEDDADLDERAAGARAKRGSTPTISHPRRVLLLRRRLRSSRGCGVGCSRAQAAPQ
jgi:hypothetical protein